MRRNPARLLTAVLLFFFSAALLSGDPPAAEPVRLAFGYSSGEDSVVIYGKIASLLAILEEETGIPIDYIHTNSYQEAIGAFVSGSMDIGILSTLAFIHVERQIPIHPVALRLKGHDNLYRSYIFTARDSQLNSLDDLRGTVFAFGDPFSTSSDLIPRKMMHDAGIDPKADLARSIHFPNQDSIFYAVLNGTVQAGAAASFIFEEQDPSVSERLKIIARSEPFPLGPFVARDDLAPEVEQKIREVLLSLPYTEEGRRALRLAELDGFINPEGDPYRDIRNLVYPEE